MSALINLTSTEYHLTAVLDGNLLDVDALLRNLSAVGIEVRNWNVTPSIDLNQVCVSIDLVGDAQQINAVLVRCEALRSCDFLITSEAIRMELAVLTVNAEGSDQDEALSMVATAGGRLLKLNDEGFIAQISERSDRIQALMNRLQPIAEAEIRRSGSIAVRRA